MVKKTENYDANLFWLIFSALFSVISLLTPGFTWFYQTSSTRVKPHFNPLWLKNGRFWSFFEIKRKFQKRPFLRSRRVNRLSQYMFSLFLLWRLKLIEYFVVKCSVIKKRSLDMNFGTSFHSVYFLANQVSTLWAANQNRPFFKNLYSLRANLNSSNKTSS